MTKRKTHEEFVQDVYNLVGDEYTVLGKYTLSKNKILLRHNHCKNKWETKANNFISGQRCPECSNNFKSTDTFKSEVKALSNDTLDVLGEYVNCTTHVLMRCKIHNHTFKSSPTNVLRGKKVCTKCNAEYLSEVQRKSDAQFCEELKQRHKGAIVCEEPYINTHTKLRFRCLVCDSAFSAEPNAVLRISGCPTCATSKGEITIREYLAANNVKFESQRTFDDCKHVRPLPFDFYIPSHNLLIEYDGKQHYAPVDFFGGLEGFEYQLLRDSIKNNFAKENGIVLLRIPYTVAGNDIHVELDRYFKVGSLC